MSFPTVERMLRPLLALAMAQEVTRNVAAAAMAEHFNLLPEEREQRIPSGGSTVVRSRAGWTMTYLTKGKLIAKVATKTYRATAFGRTFLASHPGTILVKDLEALEGWKDAWQSDKKRKTEQAKPNLPELGTSPAETIDSAMAVLHADLRDRLLEAILAQSPEFFERLVLDVLIKMGYGGSREEAAEHMGQSGDEGIDGRISQDALGLDQILVQAKRYAPDRVIDRKTIQAFIGSLAGQGVSKGIFITTSYYAETAREFVQRGSQTKIVLMDGRDLLDHMLRYRVGVRVERAIELLDIDQNYFDDQD